MAERYADYSIMPRETHPAFSLQDRYASEIVSVCEYLCSLNIREATWNSGPWVDKFLRFAGMSEAAPWCTSVACWVLQEAATRAGATDDTCPDYPSGAKLARWALKHPGQCVIIRDAIDLQAGDVVIMGSTPAKARAIRRGRLRSGHTYIAGGMALGPEGRHPTFEGNTNAEGAREGDTFRRRVRAWTDPRVALAIRFLAIEPKGVA